MEVAVEVGFGNREPRTITIIITTTRRHSTQIGKTVSQAIFKKSLYTYIYMFSFLYNPKEDFLLVYNFFMSSLRKATFTFVYFW